ncbi:DUF6264 family protein [Leucobacter allii]|uniref:DUF6264 family protein n=1 Tax=Leucobacter allii TaxID=2932247 RepID=A0ABY4FHR7_9MICO|nr:DUF6264 family protein [Leucobacter allii]UOQ56226.1 DUF6264 family protein [Leucobacter allii]
MSDPQLPAPEDRRTPPAYGEYAPEGWEWKPEGAPPAGAGAARTAASTPAGSGGSPVPGVPHNLGARGGDGAAGAPAPAAPSTPAGDAPRSPTAAGSDPEPYRAAPPQQPAPRAPRDRAPGTEPGPRTGDRVVTILLLALGAFGALSMAQSMLGLAPSLAMILDAFDLQDVETPSWLGVLGSVSAIAIFALYAVSLIFSIQRMRARKITFWVPLTAGAIALIGIIVVTSVAMAAIPELMTALADPASTQQLLDYMAEMTQ